MQRAAYRVADGNLGRCAILLGGWLLACAQLSAANYSIAIFPDRASIALAGDSVIDLKLIGADPNAELARTNEAIRVKDVYPGVDWVWRRCGPHWEYDFIVAPHVDPSVIAFQCEGGGTLRISARGELEIPTASGCFRQHRPVLYQDIHGARHAVDGRFELSPLGDVVQFSIGDYDRKHALVIDPVLVFQQIVTQEAPYYTDIAIGREGDIHLSGFVTTADGTRALISKRSPDGADERWTLVLGDNGAQFATGIAVDAQGNVYVAGWTSDANFPLKNPMQSTFGGGAGDVFVVKVNASGTNFNYITFLGGPGDDLANQIVVDAEGSVYITGTTIGSTFPVAGGTVRGQSDAYVVKLNSQGSAMLYGSLLGGSGVELGNGLTVDVNGRAYLIGLTASEDLPLMNPLQSVLGGPNDVHLTMLDHLGNMTYSSYLGGGGIDIGTGIALDGEGNPHITGLTASDDFPLANAFQDTLNVAACRAGQLCSDAFVAKLNPSGSSILYSTYLGGNEGENGGALTTSIGLSFYGIDVDAAGFAYVTGTTNSFDFPIVNPLPGSRLAGALDLFLTKFSPNGSLVYSSYLTPVPARQNLVSSVTVDQAGNAYLAGASFPNTANREPNPGSQGYIAKVFDLPILPSPESVISPGDMRRETSIRLKTIQRLADRSIQLGVEAPASIGYVVEGSADLRSWTPLFTHAAPVDPGNPGGGGGKK